MNYALPDTRDNQGRFEAFAGIMAPIMEVNRIYQTGKYIY
jgi:hypothetical protein